MSLEDVEEKIRKRAYELWEQDGCPHGRDWEHWHRARDEVLGPDGTAAPAEAPAAPAPAPTRKGGRAAAARATAVDGEDGEATTNAIVPEAPREEAPKAASARKGKASVSPGKPRTARGARAKETI